MESLHIRKKREIAGLMLGGSTNPPVVASGRASGLKS